MCSSAPLPHCLSDVSLIPPCDRVLLEMTFAELSKWSIGSLRTCLLEAERTLKVHGGGGGGGGGGGTASRRTRTTSMQQGGNKPNKVITQKEAECIGCGHCVFQLYNCYFAIYMHMIVYKMWPYVPLGMKRT